MGKEIKKEKRGGATRVVDPIKGKAKRRDLSLYDYEFNDLVKWHGSLTKAAKVLHAMGNPKAPQQQ